VTALPIGTALAPPSAIVATSGAPIETMTYRMWLERPVAEVASIKGDWFFWLGGAVLLYM
jgi:hypothetical protein